MGFRDSLKISLPARLALAAALSVSASVLIALIVFLAFKQVRSDIADVVSVHLENTLESSRQARDLGQLLNRLALLEASFYGNDEYLQQEGSKLLELLNKNESLNRSHVLLDLQKPLYDMLVDYLGQCKIVNDLLYRLSLEEQELYESFVIVEEIIAAQIIEAARRGEQADHFEQLTMLIGRYQVELIELFQLNAIENPQDLFAADFLDLPANAEKVSDLVLKLKALTKSQRPLNRFGRHLTGQLKYYEHLMGRFQQEMIHLGSHSAELNKMTEHILAELEAFEQQYAALANQTAEKLDTTIRTTGAVVLTLLIALVMLLGLIELNIYTKHIKLPMQKISSRLLKIQEGDYSTPMTLERNDEWGQIENVFNDMLDDLKQSWTAVQESERRYRNIFDSASVGIYQSTIDGTFLNINPALAIMLNIEAFDELSAYTDLGKMIYPDPNDRKILIDRLIAEETISHYEVQLRRKNGETFWASINGHLVRDKNDKIQFIEGTIDDISQRRQTQQELQSLKEYLQDIVDTMPSILIGVDDKLKITIWNWQVSDMTGIGDSDAFGKPLEDVFDLIDMSEYLKTIEETISFQNVVRLRKVSGINAGTGRFFDVLIYPLSSAETLGAVIHMDDVTEKTQIEEVMVQSEKMLSVGSLAAGMAHEINNPLASVLQNVQVMEQRLSPALKKNREVAEQLGISVEQVADYARLRGFDKMIKSIADAGQRAAKIIENMLNFSRKSSSTFVPCSLEELVEKTIELANSDYEMKHSFDFRSIKIVRDYQKVPEVPCEASQIQQVTLSLLKNAAQALSNKQGNPEIRVRILQENGNVCLQIADNGDGMDEATCRRIFEPFYTTKDVGQGTGLGLSVAYFLITENHRGNLTVTSTPGEGSCFSVSLPIRRVFGVLK